LAIVYLVLRRAGWSHSEPGRRTSSARK